MFEKSPCLKYSNIKFSCITTSVNKFDEWNDFNNHLSGKPCPFLAARLKIFLLLLTKRLNFVSCIYIEVALFVEGIIYFYSSKLKKRENFHSEEVKLTKQVEHSSFSKWLFFPSLNALRSGMKFSQPNFSTCSLCPIIVHQNIIHFWQKLCCLHWLTN